MTEFYIKQIIDFYNYGLKKPKLWNVDTNYIETIKRLIKNLKKSGIKEIRTLATKKIHKEDKECFILLINDIDVTPISRNKLLPAKSTMRQYLQFMSSFSWIKFEDINKKWFKEEYYQFPVNIGMNKLLIEDEFDFKKLLIELIITGSISYIEHKQNLAYTFFLYYVFNKKPSLMDNLKLELEKVKKKESIKFFNSNSNYAKSYFNHSIKRKGVLSNTFYKSFELLESYDFDNLILNIYQTIIERYNDYDEIKNNNDIDLNLNYSNRDDYFIKETFNDIKSTRGRLRENIINQRIHDKNYHSDIKSLDNLNPLDEKPIYILEACHIYEIHQIKELANNSNLNHDNILELLNYCEDPNNGLMLPKEYHYFFDRGIIMFDLNGNSIFLDKYINDLKKCNIHPFRIKEEYFNNKMKEYLIKRYN